MPSIKNNNTNVKSKLLLLVIASLGLGLFGIDRFYAGDTVMGVLKLLTFGGLGIWAFIDWIIVLINALAQSKNGVFGITKWDDKDDNVVFYVAIIFLLLHVGVLPGLIMGFIGFIMASIGMAIGGTMMNNRRTVQRGRTQSNCNNLFGECNIN
jgi:TM2 domain-containing membrane protein YozV